MKENVLFIDDEQPNLDGFFYTYSEYYNITLALSPSKALEHLEQNRFKVIVSDQRMEGMTGIEFFTKHKEGFNNAILIILTAYSESEDLIDAINQGGIYRYILKPWNANDLKITIDSALEVFNIKEKNAKLLNELEIKNLRLEDALCKARESDKMKSSFINNMSHEVRTPLNGIMGFIDIIKYGGKSPEKIEKYLDIIYKSSVRLFNIVDDILDFSLLTNHNLKAIYSQTNINQVILELYNNFNPLAGEKQQFNSHISDNQLTINTDDQKLKKIISKIIDNALKYTKHGTVDFGVAHVEENNNSIVFFVKDTGIGIAEKYWDHMFEPYTQEEFEPGTLNEGNGLGLAIAKKLIDIINGEITFKTEKDVGTTFYIKVPIDKP